METTRMNAQEQTVLPVSGFRDLNMSSETSDEIHKKASKRIVWTEEDELNLAEAVRIVKEYRAEVRAEQEAENAKKAGNA
jgi:hypothetical protein